MKKLLFLLLLFCGYFLLDPAQFGVSGDSKFAPQNEIVKENTDFSDMQARIMTLKSDLSTSTCLTPRTVQLTPSSFCERYIRTAERLLQGVRIKNENLLLKTSESVALTESVQVSSLRFCTGYLVFALRKIII